MIRKQVLVLALMLCSLTTNSERIATYDIENGSGRALMSNKIEGWKGFYEGDSSCVSVVTNGLICGWNAQYAGLECGWSYAKCIFPKCEACCGAGIFSWQCVICKCSWDCSSKKCNQVFKKAAKTCKIATDDCVKAFNHLDQATKKFFKNVANAIKDIVNKIKHAAKWVAQKVWKAAKWVYDQIKKLADLKKLFEVAKAIGQAFKCFGKLGSSSQIRNASRESAKIKTIATREGKKGIISKIDSHIPGFKAFVCCMQSTAIGRVLNKWGKSLKSFHKSWKGLKVRSILEDPAFVVSLAVNVAGGFSVGTSLDIAISTAFNIGLYWSQCTGFVTDAGVGVSVVLNLFRKFSFIPGKSVSLAFSVGIPETPIGIGAGIVLPIVDDGAVFGAVNVEVGVTNGISPVSVGGHVCNTEKLVEFNLLELLGNILTANNECPKNISINNGGSAVVPNNGGGGSTTGSNGANNKQCAVFGCNCQGMSNKYNTKSNSWGKAPAWAKTWWKKNACNTKPNCQIFGCSCQGMSNKYGTDHNSTWGTAPAWAGQWWLQKRCSTRPQKVVIEEIENRRLLSNKILTEHKEKIIQKAEKVLREELKTERGSLRLLAEAIEVVTTSDAGTNKSPFKGIDTDVCGARNIAATKKFEETDGISKLTNKALIAKLCSTKCQKHKKGESEPKQCRNLRANACERGLLGLQLNSEIKCCRMLLKDPEDLVFHIRKLCAMNGAITKPTKQEFCKASKKSATQIKNNFDIVNTIIDGCVLHFSEKQCKRLKGIKKASVFAKVANGLCNSKSRMIKQLSEYSIETSSNGEMVVAIGMGVFGFAGVLSYCVLKNKNSQDDIEFEEIL